MFLGTVILIVCAAVMIWLLSPRMRHSDTWRAIATPLASIIGSGFLIVGPLLGATVGAWAPVAMAGIVLLAYGVGACVRYQIRVTEALLAEDDPSPVLQGLERASGPTLAVAYVISVAFYLRLLSAFALSPLTLDDHVLAERALTTAVLVGIGVWGMARGLEALESLEDLAVSLKLAIIAALLVGVSAYDWEALRAGTVTLPTAPPNTPLHTVRVLAGLLLVVQGFETSRYLGAEYTAEVRARTMKIAQWVSGAIYVVFVALCVPLLANAPASADETAVIQMTAVVHPLLPHMLLVAALMSQFSAAVADTIGGGGLIHELTRSRVSVGLGYGILLALAAALTWTANIFEVISLASRAFALYYALQATSAAVVAHRRSDPRAWGFGALALLLVAIVVFAVPAD
ncbi:MAG: hypothetical protein H6725_07385 [Sandaracinaceae bacterium]|nr:hypothetical protein [Sandaracinaceae bacterium]